MRTGIFGGTFDPVHLGHLILAEQCRDQAQLDQVRFVPSARPPHKPDAVITPFERRLEMLQLATTGHPAFQVDPLENDRDGPSYTADTLDLLAEREPTHELFLILGADCIPDLPHWYDPVRILRRATLLIVERPGSPRCDPEPLARDLGMNRDELRVSSVECPLIGISSTDIRQRITRGASIRYLVPRSVEEYIREKSLYR